MSDPITTLVALGIAKPIVETACSLAKDLLSEPAKAIGGLLDDQIYAWRVRNRVEILAGTKRLLDERGVDARVLPPGFLVPMLDACGDAEDEDLQDAWARLLAGAVEDEAHAHPLLVEALKGLDGSDARYFASVFHVGTRPVRGRLLRQASHYVGVSVSEPREAGERRSWERLLAKGLLGRQLTSDLADWGRSITSFIDGSTGGRIPSRLEARDAFRTEVVITPFGGQLADALGLVPQALIEHGQTE